MQRAIAGAEPTEGWEQVVSFDADVRSGDLPLKIFHGGFGRQDAILPDQAENLGPERDKRDEIDNRKGAKKEPANEKVLRRFDVLAPEPASEGGK